MMGQHLKQRGLTAGAAKILIRCSLLTKLEEWHQRNMLFCYNLYLLE